MPAYYAVTWQLVDAMVNANYGERLWFQVSLSLRLSGN